MNKKYEIRYLPLFQEDLKNILNYIKYTLDNPQAAERLLEKVMREIEDRSYEPEAYETYKSKNERKYVYYRIYVKNYIVFYVVKENIMEVRRILYSKSNFKRFI